MHVLLAEASETLQAGIVGAMFGGVPGFLAAIVVFMKGRRELTKDARKDAIAEWEQITTSLKQEVVELRTAQGTLHNELLTAKVAEARCQGQVAQLQGDVNLLQSNVRRLQEKLHDTPPGTVLPCEIIADKKGIIRWASAAVGPMFHWLPTELVGRNITALMPKEIQPIHKRAFDLMFREGRKPNPEKPVLTTGLTKLGGRFPIMINLSGWEGATPGAYYLNAEISRRGDSDVIVPMGPDDVPTCEAEDKKEQQ